MHSSLFIVEDNYLLEHIIIYQSSAQFSVFVKDSGVVPFMEAVLHASMVGQKINLAIRHYGTLESIYRLYYENGETFDCETGMYCRFNIYVKCNQKMFVWYY